MGFKSFTGYEKKVFPMPEKPKKNKIQTNFGFINCKACGKGFNKKRKAQQFCTTKCRVANWMKEHPRVVITLHKEKSK